MTTLSTLDIAYTAGFFDGEGCVRLVHNKNDSYTLRAYIGQKDVRPLQWLQERFPGGSLGKYQSHVAWMLYWHGQGAYSFLQTINPYLITKRAQAELAMKAFEDGLAVVHSLRNVDISLELSRMKRELV